MIGELQQLRSDYEAERERLREHFLATGDAEVYLTRHAEAIDALVAGLAAPPLEEGPFCVLATAGYGRREQFPHSDVDLLVVHRLDERTIERVISPFLSGLWDARLDLGHQVWSLDHLNGLALEDYEFVLALFNARVVAGDEDLGAEVLEELLPRFIEEKRPELVERVLESVRARHEGFGNTIYQLEPDVKEAPGGLRDYLAATWLHRLVGVPRFLPYSRGEVKRAHLFQMRLRILLHLFNRRGDNRLSHAMQEKVADFMGFAGMSTQAAVEALMKEYFVNARILSGYCASMIHAASPEDAENPLQPSELPSLDDAKGILEAFRISLDEERPLSAHARSLIVEALPAVSETIRFPELRDEVIDLFRPRAGLYRILSELHELGVLELLFPEFSNINARVIRDFYHKYTVDEHTLIALKSIEDLATGDPSADPRMGAILRDTVVPYHVTLSLLFHDVGKGRGGKHADESARMAARALRRYQFDRDEAATVVFLIRNHLAMSSVIFRRDIEDDEVLKRFADLVETPERLRLLTLVTYADIKAVAPGTLNDWKKDLLWQLYLECYRKLTLEYGEDRIQEEDVEEKLLKGLEPSLDREGFERFLEGFPTRYLVSTPPSEIYNHYRMSTQLSEINPVECHISRRKTYYELCVVTPDRKRLFAKIVGLLSYFEMNILRGFGFTNNAETILDFFQFSDERKAFRQTEERERFQRMLKQAVVGEVSVRKLLQGKESSVLFRRTIPDFESSLYFEDDPSGRYTILEIIAPDALGLLFRISSQIAELECEIDLALISTEGQKAVDVFYLSYREAMLSPEIRAELETRIRRSISAGPSGVAS